MSTEEIKVNVLYFGLIRELCGTSEEKVEIAAGSTVESLVDGLVDRYPDLAKYRHHVQMSVNETLKPTSTALSEGDRVAFIPQVAGGSDRYNRLTEQRLSVDEVMGAVADDDKGGIVIFVGNVRSENQGHEVTHLEYQAYPEMVLKTFDSILDRCEAVGEGVRVAVAHRTGDLQIGDAAVIIAAAAPHRAEAFEAARMCIELLKQETPIWKKEYSPEGEEWIGTRP